MPTQSLGNVDGSQDRRRPPDAFQNASEEPLTQRGKKPHNKQKQPEIGQQLIDCLVKAQGDLQNAKEEISGSIHDALNNALQKATALARAL